MRRLLITAVVWINERRCTTEQASKWTDMAQKPYRVVQPWGRETRRRSANTRPPRRFAEIDRLSAQMVRTGAPSDAVELIVVDAAGELVPRPGAQ